MALSTQAANLVWQKVNIALANANPFVANQFRVLKAHLAQFKSNPDLEFVPFVAASIAGASGQVLADAANKLYAVYGKKAATATDSYLVILDDATDDTGGATDARISLPFLVASELATYYNPNGLDMAAGVVAKAYTDFDGVTDSATADSPDGFVIIGKP